jgi:hypothetical protein
MRILRGVGKDNSLRAGIYTTSIKEDEEEEEEDAEAFADFVCCATVPRDHDGEERECNKVANLLPC